MTSQLVLMGYFTLIYNIIPILKYKDKGWYLDKHLLSSASEDTLVTAMGTVEIQSATNLHSGNDTPYPEARLSTETMQLLQYTAARLEPKDSTITQPSKKRRLEAYGDKKRTNYPQASKSIYLQTKTLHRRKLSLATNTLHIKVLVSVNMFRLPAVFNLELGFMNIYQVLRILRKP